MPSTPESIKITKDIARRFLTSHHFLNPPRSIEPGEIISTIFHRLGCIQFDSINVVGRNADLVLQSRVRQYQPQILEDLLYQSRQLIDGWDKVASIYPAADWPSFSRHRERMEKNSRVNDPTVIEAYPRVLEEIRKRGPLSSIDFKEKQKTDWWWGPTSVPRAALEGLYAKGKVGINHRVNTRRYFDLIENLIPADILDVPDPNATVEQNQDWHVTRRVGSVGLAMPSSGEHWLGIHTVRTAAERRAVLKRLVEKGILLKIEITDIPDADFFIRAKDLHTLENSEASKHESDRIAFIAPLDNLIWNRKMINLVFGFQYIWEVYKPAAKREYGYYVLPVLYRDKFIARADMKYQRKTQELSLQNWWWEEDAPRSEATALAVKQGFQDFLQYLGADRLTILEDNFSSRKKASYFSRIARDLS